MTKTVSGDMAEAQENAPPLLTRTLIIRNKRGLHARAAARFVTLADTFDADITVSRGGQTVSGLSIMGLMMLAAAPGCEVDLCISGHQAEKAMAALRGLIEAKFEED